MKRFLVFAAVFPPIAMLVFMSPDMVTKGIPARDDLLAWLIASYPIAIVPALIAAGIDQALATQGLRLLKTTAAGGVMCTLIALFLSSGYTELWPAVMVFLVGALPTAVCSWLADPSQRLLST